MSPSPSPPPPAPCPYAAVTLDVTLPSARDDTLSKYQKAKDATVLIVGGGISGIITIQTLKGGITNFEIIEARGKFGGRLPGETFGEPGRQVTVEVVDGSLPWHPGPALTNLPYRLAWTGSGELVVRVEIPKTPSGPSFKNMLSRHENFLTVTALVRIITTSFTSGVTIRSPFSSHV